MAAIEHFLDPLLRPPLSLAVIAAGLKYVATVLVLEDPLLLTRRDYVLRRQAGDAAAGVRRRGLLAVQLLFVGLAGRALAEDLAVVSVGFRDLPVGKAVHVLAMVLAFSPNTVAAVAGTSIMIVKAWWGRELPPYQVEGLCRISDVLARIFGVTMGLCYLVPLMLVSLAYGCLGLCAVAYVFVYDVCTFPRRLCGGDLGAIWVAFPVSCAMILGHVLTLLLIAGQVWAFERRYPEMARRIDSQGTRVSALTARVPQRIRAQIIGSAREMLEPGAGMPADKELFLNLAEEGASEERHEQVENGCHGSAVEKCILNDEVLAFLTYARVSACLAMPILQLSVTIAARVFLGDGVWDASQETFRERGWARYAERTRARAGSASSALTLLWYYL